MKKKPAKQPAKKNAAPSLVGSLVRGFFPLEDMTSMAAGIRGDLKRAKQLVTGKKNAGSRKNASKRQNSSHDEAVEMYRTFHGAEPTETLTVIDKRKYESNLAALGELREIVVVTPTKLKATIKFDGECPLLACSPDGRQLYIEGGEYRVDLDALDMDGYGWLKPSMVLGVLVKVTYRTEKDFHDFELIDYYHALGEETGNKPMLIYDTLNHLLSVSGGEYLVKREGIVN